MHHRIRRHDPPREARDTRQIALLGTQRGIGDGGLSTGPDGGTGDLVGADAGRSVVDVVDNTWKG